MKMKLQSEKVCSTLLLKAQRDSHRKKMSVACPGAVTGWCFEAGFVWLLFALKIPRAITVVDG